MPSVNNVNFIGIEGYDGSKLLDQVKLILNLKNDAALSRALNVVAPVISKIRNNRNPFPAYLLLRVNELTGLSYVQMRVILGEPDWRDM